MFRNIIILVFGVALGYFIFGAKGCVEDIKNAKYDTLLHEIDTIYQKHDSIIYKKGKDIHHDTTIYVDIPVEVLRNVDTAAILKEYYAINVKKDTINLADSLGWVSVTDSIQQNNILGRSWEYSVKSKTIVEKTVLKEKPKNRIYLGITSGGPGVLYTTKNNFAFNLSTTGKLFNAGVYYKIK